LPVHFCYSDNAPDKQECPTYAANARTTGPMPYLLILSLAKSESETYDGPEHVTVSCSRSSKKLPRLNFWQNRFAN
jgi:hypothetical protein